MEILVFKYWQSYSLKGITWLAKKRVRLKTAEETTGEQLQPSAAAIAKKRVS